MSIGMISGPFDDDEVNEVPLEAPPIELALVQIRFPRLTKLIEGDIAIREFANSLSDLYPILEGPEHGINLTVGPDGVVPTQNPSKVWRLRSGDEKWKVSVGENFVSLDTSRYGGRDDFCDRLSGVITPFTEIASPPFIERVGVRYINRMHNPDRTGGLPQLIRSEVSGQASVPLPETVQLHHSISESRYVLGNETVQIKTGYLSEGLSHDSSIQPADHPTWIMDIDAFSIEKRDFTSENITRAVRALAELDYRYFRWAVTSSFLDMFGGKNVS